MDTFKGQGNDDLRELCAKNNYQIVIISHNLTNKFHPLDLSVNKAVKASISEKYNTWTANEISKQLKKGPPFGDKTLACQKDCRFVSPFES